MDAFTYTFMMDGRTNQNLGVNDWLNLKEHLPHMTLDEFLKRKIDFWKDWLIHPNYDSYWAKQAMRGRFHKIKVPSVTLARWYDDGQHGSIKNYYGIMREGEDFAKKNAKLIMGYWIDGGPYLHSDNDCIKLCAFDFNDDALGRVIERITGQSYEDYVKTHVLNPIGITRMQIGHSLENERVEGEVRYYDYPGAPLVLSVFSSSGEMVPRPYGGYYLEAMDAHGGWIASAIDLARFLTAVDGRSSRPDILKPSTLELMLSRPDLVNLENSDRYYAMGWWSIPEGELAQFYHTGRVPGGMGYVTCTLTYEGSIAWTAVVNSMPKRELIEVWGREWDGIIWEGIRNILEWPSCDLFDDYPGNYEHYGNNLLKIGKSAEDYLVSGKGFNAKTLRMSIKKSLNYADELFSSYQHVFSNFLNPVKKIYPPFQCVGVILSEKPSLSMAVIKKTYTNRTYLLKEGEEFLDWKLIRIYKNRIILEKDGKAYQLFIRSN